MSQEITPLSVAAQLGHDTMRDIANIKAIAHVLINWRHDMDKEEVDKLLTRIEESSTSLQKTIDNFYIASKPEVPSTDVDTATNSLELE